MSNINWALGQGHTGPTVTTNIIDSLLGIDISSKCELTQIVNLSMQKKRGGICLRIDRAVPTQFSV